MSDLTLWLPGWLKKKPPITYTTTTPRDPNSHSVGWQIRCENDKQRARDAGFVEGLDYFVWAGPE